MKKFKKRRTRTDPAQNSLLKNKDKLNAPPLNPGIQDVPRSLKDFMKLKELAVESHKESNTKKRQRGNAEVRVIQNSKTNTRTSPFRGVNSMENISSRTTSNFTENTTEVKTRSVNIKQKRKIKLMKLKLKRKLKKEQKKKNLEDGPVQDMVKEDIKFGEVVHKPPQLSVLPRKVTKTGFENRPGRKDDLLLKSLLNQTELNRKSQLCQKRKYLSASDQRQLELERKKSIISYKASKRKSK